MNRRVLGVVAAILLAAVGTWVLVQYVNNAEQRVVDEQEPVEVLVVETAIAQGTPVSEASSSIVIKAVPGSAVVPGALSSLDPVRGQVTAVDLLPGEQVLASRFVARQALEEAIFSQPLPEGMLEVTLTFTPERSVGGSLVPGDLVAVLSSFEPFTLDAVEPENEEDLNSFLNREEDAERITLTTPNSTGITAHKALVTRVQVSRPPEDTGIETTADVAPTTSLLVSLAVPPTDLEQIVFSAEYGSLWLAREHPDVVEEDPALIITRANVYR